MEPRLKDSSHRLRRPPPDERNLARWLFLDPTSRSRYPDWEDIAVPTAAALRAAHDPRVHDEVLEQLVGELTLASPEFARYWADYRIFRLGHGRRRIFNEAVGVMTLNYESLHLPDDDGQFISTYQADAGSADEDKLRLLMSWDAPAAPRLPAPAEVAGRDNER